MPLTVPQRQRAREWWIKRRGLGNPPVRFTKPQIDAALDAATTWIEANQASFVTSLNGTAFGGGNSTADEKRRLFLAAFHSVYDVED